MKIHPGLKKLFTSPDCSAYRWFADTKPPADLDALIVQFGHGQKTINGTNE